MKPRVLAVLFVLFFGGLAALWWAEHAGIRSAWERRQRANRVLPELTDLSTRSIGTITITYRKNPDHVGRVSIVKDEAATWKISEGFRPRTGVMADSARVEALLSSLRELAPLPDSGDLTGSPESYGLGPNAIEVSVHERGQSSTVAELTVGKTVGNTRYVKAENRIVAVDASMLAMLDQPPNFWREARVFPVRSPLELRAVEIIRHGEVLKLERAESGWKIIAPFRAPADAEAVNKLIGELLSLRAESFPMTSPNLATAEPWLTVVATRSDGTKLQVRVTAAAPDAQGRYFALRGDDLLEIASKPVDELGTEPRNLRGKQAIQFDPKRTQWITVREGGRDHALAREPRGWVIVQPHIGAADTRVVSDMLQGLEKLEAVSILPPNPSLDFSKAPEGAVVRLWEGDPVPNPTGPPSRPADAELSFGPLNRTHQAVPAQTGGDSSILLLPEAANRLVPRGAFAFRDRAIQHLPPDAISSLQVEGDGKTVEVASAGRPNDYAHWRMLRPVAAAVNTSAVARAVVLLANLRAANLVADGVSDLQPYGLDKPWRTLTWKGPGPSNAASNGTLAIGTEVPKSRGERYATITGSSLVFTLLPESVALLITEFHDPTVLSFPTDQVRRIVLTEADGVRHAFTRRDRPFDSQPDWAPEGAPPGASTAATVPLNSLLKTMAELTAIRFEQYEGPFPADSELSPPRLRIEVELASGLGTRVLRVGRTNTAGLALVTSETSDSGLIAEVPAGPFSPYLIAGPKPELPPNVFAH